MSENIRKLLELASANEELKARLNRASKEEVILLAREQGIELSDADFEHGSEISDDELNAVAGGKICACPFAGGGTGEDKNNTKTCACIGVGFGYMKNSDKLRCVCSVGGAGDNRAVH